MKVAQPIEAWVGEPVLQVMRVWRHTHQVQLVSPECLWPRSATRFLRRALRIAGLLERCQERALPHGAYIMIPRGLGFAIHEGAHKLPACKHVVEPNSSQVTTWYGIGFELASSAWLLGQLLHTTLIA